MPIDTILLLAMLFPGIFLLTRAILKFKLTSCARLVQTGLNRMHTKWTGILIDYKITNFPCIRLINPNKSWISAELGVFVTACLGCNLSSSAPDFVMFFLLVLVIGPSLLFLSLKSESAKTSALFQQDLPLAAFLMSLLMESGLGSAVAMKETIAALPSRGCSGELSDILRGRELGIPKRELFDSSRNRVPLDDYRAFLNLIEQGERLGVGLSQGLNELSRRILESQSHRAEMIAQQAAVKMLLPLVLFIFPAVFMIVLSPVILNLLSMAGW
jgi:tight adherence protein C